VRINPPFTSPSWTLQALSWLSFSDFSLWACFLSLWLLNRIETLERNWFSDSEACKGRATAVIAASGFDADQLFGSGIASCRTFLALFRARVLRARSNHTSNCADLVTKKSKNSANLLVTRIARDHARHRDWPACRPDRREIISAWVADSIFSRNFASPRYDPDWRATGSTAPVSICR
jgi:hypothetical protein